MNYPDHLDHLDHLYPLVKCWISGWIHLEFYLKATVHQFLSPRKYVYVHQTIVLMRETKCLPEEKQCLLNESNIFLSERTHEEGVGFVAGREDPGTRHHLHTLHQKDLDEGTM